MDRRRLLAAAVSALVLASPRVATDAYAQSAAGWVTVVDGKSMGDWKVLGKANWRIEDGALVADKKDGEPAGFLVTKASYKDFEIRAEFWADEAANSGIFIRCTNPDKVGTDSSYEVNIFDKRPDPTFGTGAIVGIAKVDPMPKAAGKWNTFHITAKGDQLTVVLNGVKTADAKDAKFAAGPFALQYGGGVIKFRKVEVRPL